MADSINQFGNFLGALPLSKKISMAFVFVLLMAGFGFMFFWANRPDYQVLFNNLSPKDASTIVSKLTERNIPYKIEANGAMVLVPAENVHDLRLSLAGDGLPAGGSVGFEIFDQTDFRTTKFVQELNYRRALQGELARTINQFKQVNDSRVFIVLPKESLFIEDSKPASASIQLDLRSSLPANKLAAIVHLVASAVEGLAPEQITVVDTKGSVIFKGAGKDDESALLSNTQLDYKGNVENEIRKNVQSMLEGIVGPGKAIVRVNAMIDFNKITLNEEEYDPAATAVRSRRDIVESYETGEGGGKTDQSLIDQRRGVVRSKKGAQETRTKKDVATNYEINKISRIILKPAGTIQQLSVAAVIDGNYEIEKSREGAIKKTYIPRTEEELRKFEDIVRTAMGYNEDREDQVTVSSIPFSGSAATPTEAIPEGEGIGTNIFKIVGDHKKIIVNIVLIGLAFFLIVRPLLRGIRRMSGEGLFEGTELPSGRGEDYRQIPESGDMSQKEKVIQVTKTNPEKTEQLIKGWINED